MASSRRKGLSSSRWERLRLEILDRDGYRCKACGKAGKLEVDHVVPMWQGGEKWDPANLQTLCVGCHIAKTRGEFSRPDPAREKWRRLIASRV